MPDQAILDYANEKGFHRETLGRWLQLPEADAEALLELARELRVGENHFRDFLDWMEEIRLRDGISLREILRQGPLSEVLSDPRLSRNDRLKRVKEEVRRLRFPRLSQIEEAIQKRIRGIKLGPRIGIEIPPGLEGGFLTLRVRATSYGELRGLVAELGRVVEKEAVKEIFALLGGQAESSTLFG